MLKIVRNFRDLDYTQLLAVYDEQLAQKPSFEAQSDFYEDISLFLAQECNICCVWVSQGRYTACVRVEPYCDGCLMTCLETAPQSRRQGFAYSLITSVTERLADQGVPSVYAHILKNNFPSLQLHRKAGFSVQAEYGRLVDGTVSGRYFTMVKKHGF